MEKMLICEVYNVLVVWHLRHPKHHTVALDVYND